jgi:predicted Na+-dependent transporter
MKKVLYLLSPCILATAFCVVAIITGYLQMESSGGWSYLAVIIFLPVLISAIVIDVLARLFLRKKLLLFWITEIVILIIVYFIFIRKYG